MAEQQKSDAVRIKDYFGISADEATAAAVRRLAVENGRLRAGVAALVEAQRHFPADDAPEYCWRCEKPWPCLAERVARAATPPWSG